MNSVDLLIQSIEGSILGGSWNNPSEDEADSIRTETLSGSVRFATTLAPLVRNSCAVSFAAVRLVPYFLGGRYMPGRVTLFHSAATTVHDYAGCVYETS